jgi:squalene-hopene/tetraprenyl-beta-curcumene cyclase
VDIDWRMSLSEYEHASIMAAVDTVNGLLLSKRNDQGWWTGRLSTSALSTATAVMALLKAVEATRDEPQQTRRNALIDGGLNWLAEHQNSDGGWGDSVLSISNISTTMLANAVFQAAARLRAEPLIRSVDQPLPDLLSRRVLAAGAIETIAKATAASAQRLRIASDSPRDFSAVIESSGRYIAKAGGVPAVIKRYGKDHTFSVPILTHCALAGIVDWKEVIPLPFELACVPHRLYAAVRMPVVSYALPALIAIGQVIFKHQGHWNPVIRLIRRKSITPSLKVLESIQPPNGGFLEATPLTSFVCMSLLGCGLFDHVVTQRCLKFIEASVREDGSWPIDTNLTTWVTTLSVNAMSGEKSGKRRAESRDENLSGFPLSALGFEPSAIRTWLLNQQYKTIHPYTHAAPGGWSWTDLPGGVPDADDTPSAMLALMNLRESAESLSSEEIASLLAAAVWLLDLQNRDGGWPTFCRGWGTLPFDRSSCDLTAHAMRALHLWLLRVPETDAALKSRCERSIRLGIRFLRNVQRADGTWLPLWFGHQFNEDDENPLYGTSRVVRALATIGEQSSDACHRAVQWLLENQNDDGGWSARRGLESSVEETGLALDSLVDFKMARPAIDRAAQWLALRVNEGTVNRPTPIGFYFARLWYFEDLYPIIFAAAGLNRWRKIQ